MKCDICNSYDTYVGNYHHVFTIKGKKIEFDHDRRFCKKCNELVYDNVLDNEVSKFAINLYNQKYGITKEKIIELRKKYNLSQEMFASIIGCAKKTLISYEKGSSIPNDNYLITLNFLINNPNFLIDLIEANRMLFDDKKYNKIKNKISNNILINNELSEYNGYTNLNEDKIKNVILYFAKDGVLKTKLLKEMFYADFINYKKTGCSITGLEYVKLPHGPVPDQYEKIINILNMEEFITYDIEYNSDYEKHVLKSKKMFNKNIFDDAELKVLNEIKKYFKKYNSKEIEELSHNEKAYIESKPLNKISYDYSFDINI